MDYLLHWENKLTWHANITLRRYDVCGTHRLFSSTDDEQFLHHYERYAWLLMTTLFIMVYALGGHAGAFACIIICSLYATRDPHILEYFLDGLSGHTLHPSAYYVVCLYSLSTQVTRSRSRFPWRTQRDISVQQMY